MIKLSSILLSIFLTLLIAWAVKLLKWVWLRPRKLEKFLTQQGLKGNSYRLLLGDMKDLISEVKQEQFKPIQLTDKLPPHIFPYFHRIISKYGANSFVWFGPWPRLMISDPQLMKEILAKPDIFHKPQPDPIGETLAGGLLILEGDKWAKHRKIINPAFHTDKLKNTVSAVSLSCLDMLAKWEALLSGKADSMEIDVWPFIEDFSGDVISRAAFGIAAMSKDEEYLSSKRSRLVPTSANRRTKAISEERGSSSRERREAVGSDDLLGTLMESNRKQSDGMSVDDVINECKLFYFSGSETTSLLLVWTMVMLSKHQQWQSQARAEVLQVFGQKPASYHGLARLKTVSMILNEVLRLYPAAPLIARAPTKTVKLGDMTLPVGVDVMLLIGILHHDPKIWGDDVNEFRPERF